jgi:hypothetical protein
MWSCRSFLASSALLSLAACADDSRLARTDQGLAVEGPWHIPEATLALGDTQYVAYEGGGPWLGEEGCSGSMLPGTRLVGDYVAQRFAQVSLVGGYNCRPIRGTTETMSLHGAGRAVDLHIPTVGDARDADNDLGDEIGHFLIEHAELLGVQLVIWDQYSWGASRAEGQKGREYTGVNPHHDHLHVELSVEAASREDDWFSAALEPVVSEPDAGLAVDAGGEPPVHTDAGAVDAGSDEQPAPKPDDSPARPVIDPPVLDDDPLHGEDISSVTEGPEVRGETCSAQPGNAREPWGPLLVAAGAALLRVRRRRSAA